MTDNHIRHKRLDPRVTCSISLPESLWRWIEDQGGKRSAVVEQAVRHFQEQGTFPCESTQGDFSEKNGRIPALARVSGDLTLDSCDSTQTEAPAGTGARNAAASGGPRL